MSLPATVANDPELIRLIEKLKANGDFARLLEILATFVPRRKYTPFYRNRSLESSIHEAIKPVLKEYGVTLAAVRARRRTGFIARARHECMRVAREQTSATLCEIGAFFHRDHAAVMYACSKPKAE